MPEDIHDPDFVSGESASEHELFFNETISKWLASGGVGVAVVIFGIWLSAYLSK